MKIVDLGCDSEVYQTQYEYIEYSNSSKQKLKIKSWSNNDVKKWTFKTCCEFGLPEPYPTDKFVMNGKALLMLTKHDFINRSKSCGDVLYQALAKLKSEQDFVSEKPQIKKPQSQYYSSIYDVGYIIDDLDNSYLDDGLYDYLKHLNSISLSGIYDNNYPIYQDCYDYSYNYGYDKKSPKPTNNYTKNELHYHYYDSGHRKNSSINH